MDLIIKWLKEIFYAGFDIMVANLFWALLTILLVTAPPAAAGLYYASNLAAHGQPVEWRTFFEGFRQFFWHSWRWALVNLLAIAVLLANYNFYAGMTAQWSTWAQALVIAVACFWCLIQVYTFPLLIEQSDRRLRTALRNSLVLYIRLPHVALLTALVIAAWLYLCTRYVPPAWILITPGLGAYLANRATIHMLGELLPDGEQGKEGAQ